MRMIGEVGSEAHAQRLSDYLLTQNIDAHIEETESKRWLVWVEHDDDLDRGKTEIAQFNARPDDPKYDNAAAVAERTRREREKAAERRRQNYRDVRTSSGWSGIAQSSTPVAVTMIVVCLAVFVLGNVRGDRFLEYVIFDASPPPRFIDSTGQITQAPGGMFDDVLGGQVWRLVTPIFAHGGVLHLLFNMMWLWQLGRVIEALKGSLFFGLLALGIAIFSNVAQAAWGEFYIGWHPFLGMSGVVAGLFGYAWMKSRLQPYEGLRVGDQLVGLMIGWLVICSLGIVGNIANAAHWGGLAFGMLIGAAPYLKRKLLNR